jgi:two-component system response regulator NreC
MFCGGRAMEIFFSCVKRRSHALTKFAGLLIVVVQALPKTSRRSGTPSGHAQSGAGPTARAALHVRVLVVDEKGIMREGLCALLVRMKEIEVVGTAPITTEALRSAASLRPDVVILDFPQTPLNGPKLIFSLKRELPGVRVIVLTFHAEGHLIEAALRAGADGYVLKSDSREELFRAVLNVSGGKSFISPALHGRIVRGYVGIPDADGKQRADGVQFTDRERQVIRLIAAGRRTREIAELLSLSYKTIEKHRTSLMRKLGVRNATAVAAYAIAHGLADG